MSGSEGIGKDSWLSAKNEMVAVSVLRFRLMLGLRDVTVIRLLVLGGNKSGKSSFVLTVGISSKR